MNQKLYLDCDIILDLLAERQPFYKHAAQLITLIERKEVAGFVSPLVFANLFYILGKLKTGNEAKRILNKLKMLVTILPVNGRIIEMALNSGLNDFEDAIHCYTALENQVETLITRNKRDYHRANLNVYTAEEYLKILESLRG
jgi:predicted nucleic acid-binding protein